MTLTIHKDVIPLREVLPRIGLTSYVRAVKAAKRGEFPFAFQFAGKGKGHRWYVSLPALEEFLRNPR